MHEQKLIVDSFVFTWRSLLWLPNSQGIIQLLCEFINSKIVNNYKATEQIISATLFKDFQTSHVGALREISPSLSRK